jgi:hypothetical protein
MRKYIIGYLLCLAGFASSAQAQRVFTRGYGEADLDAALRATVRGQHQLITKDLLIGKNDTIRGNMLVINARFILEGTVIGDVVGVDANMYFRPGSRVTGTVTNIAGGLYPSELAELRAVEDRPLAPYHVRNVDGDLVIEGTNTRPMVRLGGIFGLQNPEYNRVDGVRAEFGPTLLLPPIAGVEPALHASVGYATDRGDLIKRAGLALRRGRSILAFGWEDDISLTNDRWIRGDMQNSLSYIWNGKDYRNYYAAERVFGEFTRTLERGDRATRYFLRGQREDARSLTAGSPWTVLKADSIRDNPAIDPDSRFYSLIVGAESEFTGLTSAWNFSGSVEIADGSLTVDDLAGVDADFKMFSVGALYAMKAIANHTLEIEGNFRGPLGSEGLPLVRWTHVGGSGTLYTYDIGQFRGDRLVFIKSEYTIPFSEKLKLPILGVPRLKLMHNVGMAWSQFIDRDFEQNVGARIQFAVAHVRFVVDPRDGESKFSAGVSLPSKAYPWEKQQKTPLTR